MVSKKGNVGLDAIMIIVVLFVIAIAGVIGFKVIKDVNTDVQSDPDMNVRAKASLAQSTHDYPLLMDNVYIFILALLWILAIVASFFVDAHPIFLVVAIILLLIVVFVGAVLSHTYAEFIEDEDIRVEAQSFPKTNWVMDHMILLIISISVTIIIALYGKNRF